MVLWCMSSAVEVIMHFCISFVNELFVIFFCSKFHAVLHLFLFPSWILWRNSINMYDMSSVPATCVECTFLSIMRKYFVVCVTLNWIGLILLLVGSRHNIWLHLIILHLIIQFLSPLSSGHPTMSRPNWHSTD